MPSLAFEYIPKDTALDRMNPLVKFAFVGVALIFGLSIGTAGQYSDFSVLVIWMLLVIVWWMVGKVELRSLGLLLSLLKWMIVFLLFVQGLTWKLGDQTVIIQFFDFPSTGTAGQPVNFGHLTVGGALFGLLVSTRILAVVAVIPIFTMTTSMSRLNAALAKIRVPQKIIFMLVTAMRFVPLVQDSWQAIIDAQKIRGFDIDKANFYQKIRRAYIPIITPLLLLMFRRAMDLEVAINARAFGAKKERTFIEDISFKKIDYIGFAAVFGSFALVMFLRYYYSEFLFGIMVSYLSVGVGAILTLLTSLGVLTLLQTFNSLLLGIPLINIYFGYFNNYMFTGYGAITGLILLVFVIYKIIQRRR